MRDTSPFNFSSASIERLETGSGMTPLVDATVRLFEEFTLEKGASLIRHVARERRRKDEELDSFVESGFTRTTYMYDAMKEDKRPKDLLVRSHDQGVPFYYSFWCLVV